MSNETPDGLDEHDRQLASLAAYAHSRDNGWSLGPDTKKDGGPAAANAAFFGLMFVGIFVLALVAAFFLWGQVEIEGRQIDNGIVGRFDVPARSLLDVISGRMLPKVAITVRSYSRSSHDSIEYYQYIEESDGTIVSIRCSPGYNYFNCIYPNDSADPLVGHQIRFRVYYLPRAGRPADYVHMDVDGENKLVRADVLAVAMEATDVTGGSESPLFSYDDAAAKLRAYQAANSPTRTIALYSWFDRFGIKHPPIPTAEISVTRP